MEDSEAKEAGDDIAPAPEKPWMAAFGGLRDLHHETLRIDRLIEDEFERVDEEQWR